jgi:hypothetical protein
VATNVDGDLFLAGATSGALDADAATSGASELFVMKLDATGAPLWTRQLEAMGDAGGQQIVTTPSGEYVGGRTSGSLGGKPSLGGDDLFLVRFDRDGVVTLIRQVGTANTDNGGAVAVGSMGASYVGGTVEPATGSVNPKGKDALIVKVDAAGTGP